MLTLANKLARPEGDQRPHAAVIGSGFGGLAAAVRLGARGYRVTVLEQRDAPGGRAYVYRQDGFVFDAGPTIITAPFLFEELWTLCGKRMRDDIELRALDPFYEIVFDDGERVRCSRDAAQMRAEIQRIAPQDVDGFERFMHRSEQIYKTGFEELGAVPFDNAADMLRATPDLVRLGGLQSVYGLASRYVRDARVRFLLSFHPLFVGGNPFETPAVYCLIPYLERRHGVHFAMGGTGALVSGLTGLIKGQGGAVRCDAEVAEIMVSDGQACGVILKCGERIFADIVVSNADATRTYSTLLQNCASGRNQASRLKTARQSMSLFVWYFGTKRHFPDVPHHSIVLGPRYRGLIHDIFRRKRLAEDMSLYLHRPTATDPALAPAGCDAFYVLSPVPHLDAEIDWSSQAEPYRQRIAERLSQRMMPGFQDHIVTSRVMTPLDFERELGAHRGAAFGLEPILTQSAWFRPHNASKQVNRLYLVGAGTHPGAGLPGVLCSAKVLDKVAPHATEFANA